MSGPQTKPRNSKSKRQALSVWELPKLLRPVHHYRKRELTPCRERPHFRAVLAFVHRNRFAVASQIQRRFSKYMASDRTARRHLAELESLGFLDVVDTLNVGPLWPKVYFVTRRARSRLRQALRERGKEWSEPALDRKRTSGVTSHHILHELLITELLLMIWEAAQGREDFQLVTIQRRSLLKDNNLELTITGRRTRLQPDGVYVSQRISRPPMVTFLEMDLGTMSLKQMTAKFRRYHAWTTSECGSRYLKAQVSQYGLGRIRMRILVMVAGINPVAEQRRLAQLEKVLKMCPSAIRDRIVLSTASKFQSQFSQTISLPCAVSDCRLD